MAILNMRLDGDEILRKVSKPVTQFDRGLWQLLDDMQDTLADQNGAGLAAVQVGKLRRIFLVDVGDGPVEFINPRVLETSGTQRGIEGCLSFPEQWGLVTRPNYAKVEAQDRHGNWFTFEGTELCARALLHENDHLDGIVFKDRDCRMLTEEELEQYLEAQE